MTREEVNEFIRIQSGYPPELKEVNDTLFIKFDFIPYALREFIHAQHDYDQEKMSLMDRDCGCGRAYFMETNHFYNLAMRYKCKTEI